MKKIFLHTSLILITSHIAFANCEVKYNRQECFGGWIDADNNGLNTRAEVLLKNSSCNTTYHKSGYGVIIDAGCFVNTYTNQKETDAHKLEIEHIVPVKYAWECGLRYKTKQERIEFYNDFDNLTLTDRATNTEKSAKPLNEWLPIKNKCEYMVRFLDVMKKYGMSSSCIAEQTHFCNTTGCC